MAHARNITLYCRGIDPVGHAARIAAQEKQLSPEIVLCAEHERPQWVRDRCTPNTPLVLTHGQLVLDQPEIVLEFIEERHPQPALMPATAGQRACNRMYRFRLAADFYAPLASDARANPANAPSSATRARIAEQLSALAPLFESQTYFMTDAYSLVDCWLLPLLWRLPHYGITLGAKAEPVQRYARQMFRRDGFVRSLTEAERRLRPDKATRTAPAPAGAPGEESAGR